MPGGEVPLEDLVDVAPGLVVPYFDVDGSFIQGRPWRFAREDGKPLEVGDLLFRIKEPVCYLVGEEKPEVPPPFQHPADTPVNVQWYQGEHRAFWEKLCFQAQVDSSRWRPLCYPACEAKTKKGDVFQEAWLAPRVARGWVQHGISREVVRVTTS